MQRRLDVYFDYYHENMGGFSFHKSKANIWYYGAPISKGRDEPDIHGTTLFLWGIALISQVFGIDEDFGIHEFIA